MSIDFILLSAAGHTPSADTLIHIYCNKSSARRLAPEATILTFIIMMRNSSDKLNCYASAYCEANLTAALMVTIG